MGGMETRPRMSPPALGGGWCSTASVHSAVALVRAVMAQYGVQNLDTLALPDFKQHDTRAHPLAQHLGITAIWVSRQGMALVQPLCLTHSARVAQKTGLASVAEACALVVAGPGGRLYGPRVAQGGVTCALAQGV